MSKIFVTLEIEGFNTTDEAAEWVRKSLADAWILTDPPPRIVRTEIDPLAAHRAWVNAGLNSVNAGLNSKIMTIKAVREATGAGLREAKTAVETVEGGDLIAAIAYVNEKGWARPGWTQP